MRLIMSIIVLLIGWNSRVLAVDPDPFAAAKAFVATHCIKCHGPDKESGDIRFDDLGDIAIDKTRWAAVRDQVRDGIMPPVKEPKPDFAQAKVLVIWATASLGAVPGRMPNEGNLIPHELLFGKPATDAGASPQRIWRLSPTAYLSSVQGLTRGNLSSIIQPFSVLGDRGIRDFADLFNIDESATETLLRNAAIVVQVQTGIGNDGKMTKSKGTIPEYTAIMNPDVEPARPQLEAAFKKQFAMASSRPATAEELARYMALYDKCAKTGDRPAAVAAVLQAILLKADAFFRYELVPGDSGTRKMLPPEKLEQAISLTLGFKRDLKLEAALMKAAASGDDAVKAAVAENVRAFLADPKNKESKQKFKTFFREYFEYHKAAEVFKDRPKGMYYSVNAHVRDTDFLIDYILAEDKDVFRQLLTTEKSFVNCAIGEEKGTRKAIQIRGGKSNSPLESSAESTWYGYDEWPSPQPVTLPANTRIGVLMQPSWLIAWSTNFDNDVVTRGRWIRERLLGGTVSNLPIGVVAQVPDDPHRTFRERQMVTRAASCWKCHQRMDELGLPFEQFDHFGRYRTTETVLDVEATAKNLDSKGKSLGKVTKEVPLLTTGTIADSGDAKLDGVVKDPREMIRKIADSDLARQVFIRHAFRFFTGRNESLADAKTLQDADKAYLASGGSFQALVVSFMTSDPFLYRTVSKVAPEATNGGAK